MRKKNPHSFQNADFLLYLEVEFILPQPQQRRKPLLLRLHRDGI